MAASPETDAPISIGDAYSSPSPPSSPLLLPAQANSSLATAAPPEPAQLDHTNPASPPPPEQEAMEHSEASGFPSLQNCGDLASSVPSPGAPPSASPTLEVASKEKPTSPPSCPPSVPLEATASAGLPLPPLEVLPDVVTASAGSPPPPPQIEVAPSEGAPQTLSPLPTTPAKTSPRAALDASTTEAVTMASPEAASPPSASESDSHRAPAPLTPPLRNGPEGLAVQQHLQAADPEISPQVSENSEPAQPLPPQAGSTHVLSDAAVDEVVAAVSAEAAGSPPAFEATDGEKDTAPGVLPSQESGAEGALPEQQPRSPRSEVAPPCQNSEPTMLLQPPPPSDESTYCSLEAVPNEEAAVVSAEAAPVLDGVGEAVALESASEGPPQEQMQIPSSSPRMEAEPGSPDMAPPGFENFKLKWLPQPAHTMLADTACLVPEATAGPPPALEIMDMGMNISPGQPPSSKSAENCPGSPDMPPPGFENFKTSWLPQHTLLPTAEATYLPDVVTAKEELVKKACSVPVLDTMDIETNTARSLLPALESGAGGMLQVPEPSSPSPKMQPTPCSLNVAPPGSESSTLPQLHLPLPVAQTLHMSQDSAATGALCLTSENAPEPTPILELEAMNGMPGLPTSSESEARGSMQQEPSRLPFCNVQGTTNSREMMSSGSESSESLADAVITTVTVEAVDHPLTVAEVKEEAKVHILPPPLENGCDRPLPCLEPKVSSPEAQAAPRSPEITATSFENLESSQQTPPHLAEKTDSPSHLTVRECVTVKLEKTAQSVSPLVSKDTDLESAPIMQSPLKSEEKSLPNPQHQASSPLGKDVPGSPDTRPPGCENLDSSEELPPRPPLCPNFEMGQMVCGGCRELVAYPRGATHVQCFGCTTINLVLEAHQVGNVYCGQCETLLMYPFGAPAVRCSSCFFVTEIGERAVRPRMSAEQGTSPPPQELGQAQPVSDM